MRTGGVMVLDNILRFERDGEAVLVTADVHRAAWNVMILSEIKMLKTCLLVELNHCIKYNSEPHIDPKSIENSFEVGCNSQDSVKRENSDPKALTTHSNLVSILKILLIERHINCRKIGVPNLYIDSFCKLLRFLHRHQYERPTSLKGIQTFIHNST